MENRNNLCLCRESIPDRPVYRQLLLEHFPKLCCNVNTEFMEAIPLKCALCGSLSIYKKFEKQSRSVGQEILCYLRNLKLHYRDPPATDTTLRISKISIFCLHFFFRGLSNYISTSKFLSTVKWDEKMNLLGEPTLEIFMAVRIHVMVFLGSVSKDIQKLRGVTTQKDHDMNIRWTGRDFHCLFRSNTPNNI